MISSTGLSPLANFETEGEHVMFFVVNTARPASSLIPTVYGPFTSQAEAEGSIQKMRPGTYQVVGPAPEVAKFSVAQPVVTPA